MAMGKSTLGTNRPVSSAVLAGEKDVIKLKADISALRVAKLLIKKRDEDWGWLVGITRDRRLAYRAAYDEARAQGWRGGARQAIKVREDDSEEAKDYVETRTTKPIPDTEKRKIGWLSTRPEFKLEKYVTWRLRIPYKAPEVWERPGFDCDAIKKKPNDG